jgi:hypothetical protein
MVDTFARFHLDPMPAVVFGTTFARKNPYFMRKDPGFEFKGDLQSIPALSNEQVPTSSEPQPVSGVLPLKLYRPAGNFYIHVHSTIVH